MFHQQLTLYLTRKVCSKLSFMKLISSKIVTLWGNKILSFVLITMEKIWTLTWKTMLVKMLNGTKLFNFQTFFNGLKAKKHLCLKLMIRTLLHQMIYYVKQSQLITSIYLAQQTKLKWLWSWKTTKVKRVEIL